jgi:hypothetical protein
MGKFIKKYFLNSAARRGCLIGFMLFSACNTDELRRLQVDQSFEGEEIYLISNILDEHLLLAFHSYEKYQDTLFTATLADCPVVNIIENEDEDENDRKVHLDYILPNCEGTPAIRRGRLVLTFGKSPSTEKDSVKISYEGYSVNGVKITGSRILNLLANGRNRQLFSDMAEDIIIENDVGSSSRVSFAFEHELAIKDRILTESVSTGSLSGRNWTGKTISMDISQPKHMVKTCWDQKKFRPVVGEERWTVERTEVPDVVHRLVYSSDEGCETRSLIILSEGVQMEKRP